MGIAVQLYDELALGAVEVGNEGPRRLLSAELKAAEARPRSFHQSVCSAGAGSCRISRACPRTRGSAWWWGWSGMTAVDRRCNAVRFPMVPLTPALPRKGRGRGNHASTSLTTRASSTPVNRASNPWNLWVNFRWSIPRQWRIVALRSFTWTGLWVML